MVGTRRVVQQNAHSEPFGQTEDMTSHMSHTHNSQAGILQFHVLFLLQKQQHRMKVLLHGTGIASRTVAPGNSCFPAILRIDVVESDGGRTDKPYLASFQQLPVALGTRTRNQGIRISYHTGSDLFSRQINHFVGQSLHGFSYVRNLIVYNYFHPSMYLFSRFPTAKLGNFI